MKWIQWIHQPVTWTRIILVGFPNQTTKTTFWLFSFNEPKAHFHSNKKHWRFPAWSPRQARLVGSDLTWRGTAQDVAAISSSWVFYDSDLYIYIWLDWKIDDFWLDVIEKELWRAKGIMGLGNPQDGRRCKCEQARPNIGFFAGMVVLPNSTGCHITTFCCETTAILYV